MSESSGSVSSEAVGVQSGMKSTTLPAPVPKPRPATKPAVPPKSFTIAANKPQVKPKPASRRPPPKAPSIASTNNVTTNGNPDTLPPQRPTKPRHLEQEKIIIEKRDENEQDVCNEEKDGPVDHFSRSESEMAAGVKCGIENAGNGVTEPVYDDVESVISDQDSGESQQEFHPARRKESGGPAPLPATRSKPPPPKKPLPKFTKPTPESTSNSQIASKPPLPSRPPFNFSSATKGDLPQTSVAALAQKLKGVPMLTPNSGDSKSNMTLTAPAGNTKSKSPQPSPRVSPSLPSKMEHTKSNDSINTGVACNAVDKTLSAKGQDEPRRKISDTGQKKRIASRRQLPAPISTTEVPIPFDPRKRRPPPPPPASPGAEDGSSHKGTLQGPPVPNKALLRISSLHGRDRNQNLSGSRAKSRSTENIRNSAEEQSLYSYAYQHMPAAHASQQAPPQQPVEPEDDVYTEPSANSVAEFMDELKNNQTEEPSCYYEIEPDETPSESMDSAAADNVTEDKHESSGDESDNKSANEYTVSENQGDDSNDGESTSSSYDSEHDYEMPPEESQPPEHVHKHKHMTGSYDVNDITQEQSWSSDEEGDYVEPFEEPEDSSKDLDTFLDDDDDGDDYEEPLYQVYAARTLQRDRTLSRKSTIPSTSEMSLDELTQGTLRNMRMLWCELPEVKGSAVLDSIDPLERKRQEAMFEVITSEASYLKSLKILESHFVNSPELQAGNPQSVIEKVHQRVLFGNVRSVLEASEMFLGALRERQRQSTVISTISDIIEEHATKHFDVYVRYCSHQIYMDRSLKELRKSPRFVEGIEKLERCSTAQSLTLQSFLVLPMQRITRLPLLVDAICHRCEEGSDEFLNTDVALKAINKVVYDCNEGTRKMERMEELIALQPLIEFSVKPVALVSSNRWLLRRGEVMLVTEEFKSPIKKKLKQKPVYMFLFNDMLLICKKKSDQRYRVLDYATRSMIKVEEADEPSIQLDYMLSLILLENCNGKTKDFLMRADSETDKTRWLEAFTPPKAEREGERVYGTWDCPQVQAIHNYIPQQPDELSLHEGDFINVMRKLPDGWYHGERLCDGVQGWFPANHTENIRNEHVRARNLLQRYRLLAASKHLIGATQTMKSSKSTMKSVKGILSV